MITLDRIGVAIGIVTGVVSLGWQVADHWPAAPLRIEFVPNNSLFSTIEVEEGVLRCYDGPTLDGVVRLISQGAPLTVYDWDATWALFDSDGKQIQTSWRYAWQNLKGRIESGDTRETTFYVTAESPLARRERYQFLLGVRVVTTGGVVNFTSPLHEVAVTATQDDVPENIKIMSDEEKGQAPPCVLGRQRNSALNGWQLASTPVVREGENFGISDLLQRRR